MIAIEFDHRLEEHLRARRLYYRQRSRFARIDKVVAIVVAAYGAIATALVGLRWWTAIWFALAPLVWFDLLSIEPLVVRYMFKRSPKFHERTHVTFSEDRVLYRTPSINSTLDWSLFAGLLEDDELFLLLYKAPRQYAVVPKRAFASHDDQTEFRKLARRQLARLAA